MSNKLDLSLDEIISREGIAFPSNDSKRGQTLFKSNKNDNKSGFKNITFNINNNKIDSNDSEEKESIKRKFIDLNEDNSMSKKAYNSMRSKSSNNANNNGFHFDNNCGAIFVDNLKYEVNDEDIQQLFGAFGVLKRAALNYRNNGRSAGNAFVVFERKCDAINAFGSLQNISLDGRALQLSVVECNGNELSSFGPKANPSESGSESSTGSKGRHIWNELAKNYDNSSSGYESKRINYRNNRFNKSKNSDESGSKDNFNVEDLDADLDSYIAERKKDN